MTVEQIAFSAVSLPTEGPAIALEPTHTKQLPILPDAEERP